MSTKRSRRKQKPVFDDLDVEDEVEENEEKVRLEKINAPIIWLRKPQGFVIQDLPPKLFDAALTLLKEHYIEHDVLCRCVYLCEDEESLNSFMKQISVMLNDRCSICAVNEATQQLAGILIMRVMHKSDYGKVYSRVKLKSGEAYIKICAVAAHLNRKTDVYKKYKCDNFLRIYIVAVSQLYRKRDLELSFSKKVRGGCSMLVAGIGNLLLQASVSVARSMEMNVVMGIFQTHQLQVKAKKLGLEVLNEIYYVDWMENGEMIFDDPGPGNYTIALMAGRI